MRRARGPRCSSGERRFAAVVSPLLCGWHRVAVIAGRGGRTAQDVPRCVPAKLQRTEQMGWIDTGMTSLRPNCLATHSLQEHICGVRPRQGHAHV